MEERFSLSAELRRQRGLTIPRKPVGGLNAPAPPRPFMPPSRRSSDTLGLIPVRYEPYRSPVEEPAATFQYTPYRSPVEDTPAPLQYAPRNRDSLAYRSPIEETPTSSQYTPRNRDSLAAPYWSGAYRRPSAAPSTVSRAVTGSTIRRGSSVSEEAASPVSPISSPPQQHLRNASLQSVDEVISSISREVNQYQSGNEYPRIPLSPLMELSAQEAAFRTNVNLASPVGSVLRSRAATIRSSFRQATRQQPVPQSYTTEESVCTWLPITLRWPFMFLIFFISIGLASIVLGLTIGSQKHRGLGKMQDSSIFLFGWRFAPTIIAILYTFSTMAIVKAIKRTEAFARLSSADGSSAEFSLFLKFRAFWFDPFDSLNTKRNGGFRNWALFWASLVNFLGLLIIVPFSSALFSSREIAITRGATFSRMAPTAGIPLQLTTDDEILFRTASSILLNAATSSWVSNDYAVLPFWPSSEPKIASEVTLSQSENEWAARTTVYRTGLECTPMALRNYGNLTITRRLLSTPDVSVYELLNLSSFTIESADGCSLGFAGFQVNQTSDSLFDTGGGWWSTRSNFSSQAPWDSGNGTFEGMDLDHPIVLNISSQCGDRNMFIIATPMTDGEGFKAKGQICKSTYFSAEVPVTVSNTGTSPTFDFDEMLFNITKTPIKSTSLDIPAFEKAFFSQDWSPKFQIPDSSPTPTIPVRPKLGGPLALLGAQNGFDVAKMISNPNMVDQARQIKQRFFGESLQKAFDKPLLQKTIMLEGQISVSEQRIVVSLEVGIVLMVALLLSSLMTGLVLGYTRLHERPLNLLQDPASTKAVAAMISSGQNTRPLFEGLDTSSEVSMRKQLSRHRFYLRHGIIYSYDEQDVLQQSNHEERRGTEISYNEVNSKDWRPRIFQGLVLALLLASLAAILVTVGILYSVYSDHGIYQEALLQNPTVGNDDSILAALAPYSIIPTLFAVVVKLWWDSIDQTFRRLQPFISMAQGPTPSSKGTYLSYTNFPVLLVVGQALSNRHLLLALIASCAVFSEILIVSMSALWVRQPGLSKYTTTLATNMELRTVPAIFTVPASTTDKSATDWNAPKSVLANVYGNSLANWLYGATAESAYNSTPLPWTHRDWAFVPVGLQNYSSNLNESARPDNPTREATVTVPSIRARLQCTPFNTSNTAAWLTTLDFADKTTWNNATIPGNLKIGYELKAGFSMNQSLPDGSFKYWGESKPYFTFSKATPRLKCCGNGTDSNIHEAAIGYWSPAADAQHTSVVVNWITGYPLTSQFTDTQNRSHWVWQDVPKLTALNCTPIFETANAKVDIDLASGAIQDFTISDTPKPDPNAWSHNYEQHSVVDPAQAGVNVSVSYGYLFHDILLRVANSAQAGNDDTGTHPAENSDDRTFNFRLQGLNMDFMSYSSLALANKNSSTLLNPNTLANVSSTVFSTFFKHFVQTPVTSGNGLYMNGSWGMQPHGATTAGERFAKGANASNTAEAVISTPVMKLDFSAVAVYISLSILGILIATTLFIAAYHKKYLKVLPRDVDTLGSILGFVYGSERLLSSATYLDPSSKSEPNLDEKVRMGWFNGGGKRRWGIEIVDEREREKRLTERPASEDVDPGQLATLTSGRASNSRSYETQRRMSMRGRGRRESETSIADFYGAYDTMVERTPPMAVASPPFGALSPPLGTFHIYR